MSRVGFQIDAAIVTKDQDAIAAMVAVFHLYESTAGPARAGSRSAAVGGGS